MIVYGFLALALVSSWGYSFYKGYQWASKDYVIRQQTAKLRYIDITRGYYRSASEQSKREADQANTALAYTAAKLNQIEDDIKQGKYTKACSDQLFDSLRKAQR